MSSACTPILVGVASLVSEIKLALILAKFAFLTIDYSPWQLKKRMKWNWLKKIMQVDVDEICKYTNVYGRGFFDFGVFAPFCFL